MDLQETQTTNLINQKLTEVYQQLGDQQFVNFAKEFYHRASIDYLEKTTVPGLIKIVKEAFIFFENFKEGKSEYLVEIKQISQEDTKHKTQIMFTAFSDRPFIVDTLIETLKLFKVKQFNLLHPIISTFENEHISLTFFEIEKLDPKKAANIKTEIEQRFSDLTLVTNDYQANLQKIDQLLLKLRHQVEKKDQNTAEAKETISFLKWLGDGGFVFFGLTDEFGKTPLEGEKFKLGLFKTSTPLLQEELEIVAHCTLELSQKENIFNFSKIPILSTIHRLAFLDLITIKLKISDKEQIVVSIIGLLTSKALSQEAGTIPFIRQKLQTILQDEGLRPNTHDYKEWVSIAGCIPKSDLLHFPLQNLKSDLNLITDVTSNPEVRCRFYLDTFGHFISALIVMPRDRFTGGIRKKVQDYLEDVFKSKNSFSEYQITADGYPLAVLHVILPNFSRKPLKLEEKKILNKIKEFIITWDDILSSFLINDPALAHTYSKNFPQSYKAVVTPTEAAKDIEVLETINPDNNLEITFEKPILENGLEAYDLKIYKYGEGLTLSAVVPYLENIGFQVIDETLTQINNSKEIVTTIHKFRVGSAPLEQEQFEKIKKVLIQALKLIFINRVESDRLNRLLINPALNHLEISLLRTISIYLWQIKAISSGELAANALIENPKIAGMIAHYFVYKFDPDLKISLDQRKIELQKIKIQFEESLKSVSQLTFDRALRRLFNVVESTVRTNYFRIRNETRLALKIDCKQIESMPHPRPYFEIFVNAPDFSGVHLRGGKVARGGLRWSDRVDDFRTEVLGLMKTQMIKNSVIIPVGAKGGFVLKQRPNSNPELQNAVKACYIRFVRSLLEVADNKKNNVIIHPHNCVLYDQPDPYFVVAADRGTATFSDTANSIAINEFDFWLGDAFASGGSNGYDHKKLAITSRGVWEVVCRHFREIGVDPELQEFTLVGIGDMSGDVFGNGLLRSRKAKLLAAFDHRHIFIDPNPNPEISFNERKRLFDLPQSSWKDYNQALISKGGGIFDRNAKEISLSPELKKALVVEETLLSGQELIRSILKAPVDLIWNGGIGTYVKSSDEDHLNVGDRTNDDVRVDANELRAKMVGEGGNLGFTQKARIEYSKMGGRINTDAVDNSGGVNLSDLEVNIKILLSLPCSRGELSFEDRNKLLASLAEDICLKVVKRNRTQSLALSLGVKVSRKRMSYIKALIAFYAKTGFIDRDKEALPSDEEITHRRELKAGLTRPELAVIIGYTKMNLFETIVESTIPDDNYLEDVLVGYFPKELRKKYYQDILNHPLRREIIATEIANSLVERVGSTFVMRTSIETGMPKSEVIKAYLAVSAILNEEKIVEQLDAFDNPITTRLHLTILLNLSSAMDNMVRWLLDTHKVYLSLEEIIKRYQVSFQQLIASIESFLKQVEKGIVREQVTKLIMNGFPRDLANMVSSLEYGSVLLDIIEVSNVTKKDVLEISDLFSNLYEAFNIRTLIDKVKTFEPKDRWELNATRTLMANLRISMAKLAMVIIQKSNSTKVEAIEKYLETQKESVQHFNAVYEELVSQEITVAMLLVISNQLFSLSRS